VSPVFFLVPVDKEIAAEDFHALDVRGCRRCGHMFNGAFDDDLAARLYGDVPLTNVPVHPSMHKRFQDLMNWLPRETIDDRVVIEIGGGSGHLARLLAKFAAHVDVYEPCANLTGDMLPEPNIKIIPRTFPNEEGRRDADLVVCRNVLEHVADPIAMMRDIRATLCDDGFAYLEVPDVRYIIEHAAVPDIHLQHVQYFSRSNFIALARTAGMDAMKVLDIKDGHDFGVLFKASQPVITDDFSMEFPEVVTLDRNLKSKTSRSRNEVARIEGKTALYGATPHGQVYFNSLAGSGEFTCVFDDSPMNAGYAFYDPRRKVPVRPALKDDLLTHDAIIITAYLHDTAIASRLRGLGFSGAIYSTRPAPTDDGVVQI